MMFYCTSTCPIGGLNCDVLLYIYVVYFTIKVCMFNLSTVTTDDTPPEGTLRFSPLEGTDFKRLEIFKFGRWGTVCHHGFDAIAGNVSCRELGYGMMDEMNTMK